MQDQKSPVWGIRGLLKKDINQINLYIMVRLQDSFEYDFYYGALAETKARAAELRKNMTVAEKILWQ